MLFNSPQFLFLFLPVSLALFLALKKWSHGRAVVAFVGLVSLVFYSFWDFRYLGLLLASIVFNFIVGGRLVKTGSRPLLWLGVGGNLLCLAWFKYAGFLAVNINAVMPFNIPIPQVILPLGISFFTFVQIAYIVDAWRGRAGHHSFAEYLAFVTFFPHLIAGPILNHKSIMPQFHELPAKGYSWGKTAMGLSLLAMGLFKKVVLADGLAKYAIPVFTRADSGAALPLLDSWAGALHYTLQLYFDFSGYSDMAIGIGLMFGIRLPDNFRSPYRSASIIEFWRRWHITLSDFLKNYLYIPLGGNRRGEARRLANLMLTMLLGGLWHGAGWTFVIWGGLHGLYLAVNHLWRRAFPPESAGMARKLAGWILTMGAVILAWVFFRSATVAGALNLLAGMAGHNGMGEKFAGAGFLAMATAIALLMPNTMDIIAHAEGTGQKRWYSWRPDRRWAGLSAVLLAVSLYLMIYSSNRISEFIYFQF
ncbi:MAG: MBOAT family protein [Pseudomonadota bacterium]|nr:MBOAT family protein [Pseudomonadota bacterium]